MLCRLCTRITLKALRGLPGYPHAASFEVLEASAETCSLCALLWDAASRSFLYKRRSARKNREEQVYLQAEEPSDDGTMLRMIEIVTQDQPKAEDGDDPLLEVMPGYDFSGYVEQIGTVALYSVVRSPTESIVTTQRVAPDAASEAAFETVHRWIYECSSTHMACPTLPAACLKYQSPVEKDSKDQEERPRTLPSRVLDVGPSDGSQEPYLRVYAQPTTGFWVALSHCWGTIPLLRTTTQTINSHIQGIPMAKLPPSFRDAVAITRILGIRSLWIDSLCIVQDNLEDWKIESAQMSRVYGRSFLTILAAGASNSLGGCFIPRSWRLPATELQPSDSPGPFYVTEYIIDNSEPSLRNKANREPIDRRGWCLQESLLPKRTLYYGKRMMTWRCQTGSYSEQGGRQDRPLAIHHETDRSLFGYSRWEFIVQEYTSRSLTQETDKLIALAGIAEELFQIWNDAYVAGLWRGDLIRQLLWQREGDVDSETGLEVNVSRSKNYIAPSWSWAAINGSILFRAHWFKDYDALSEVVDVEVIPVNTPFGQISRGSLTLKGPMERVVGDWHLNDKHLYMAYVTTSTTNLTCFLDIPGEREWSSTEVWCLRMISKLCESDWTGDEALSLRVYCLLLVETGVVEGEFMRVGVAKLDFGETRETRETEVRTVTII
ncbi:hypothetical protein G7Y89_g2937 [Cudoniella acicularis]|uniref:Heterokaryon incompatibility domain-containing protein n=1 Tax=Cudoniella acicularis TaxID=354080 RepID=A0A8H4RTM5_9HELO|nr:hypothetical protein G7Y89_g2937 [Cudoniella acicularis]